MQVVWCLYFFFVTPTGSLVPLSQDKPLSVSESYDTCMAVARPVMARLTAIDNTMTGVVFCIPLDPANVDMETY